MLLNEQDTKALEERIKTELRFRPDAKYRGHSLLWWRRPVRLPKPWAVYALDGSSQEQIEQTALAVKACYMSATVRDERIYALDWQHSAFLFDPWKEDPKSVRLEDEAGEYWAEFPLSYPEGDYVFFLDENGVPTATVSGDASKMTAVAYLTAGTTYEDAFITVDATEKDQETLTDLKEKSNPNGGENSPTSNKGSGGCDAGLGGVALLALTGLIARKRK